MLRLCFLSESGTLYRIGGQMKETVKINNFYSSWVEILFEVPQGSTLGPTFFNIFLCDLFFFIKNKDVPVMLATQRSAKQGEMLNLAVCVT